LDLFAGICKKPQVASADGLRFVVPVRTIHAGPNPKYFGYERGVTYYNLVSDQFTGLNAIVVPGTLRDSLVLLAVVLEQPTELKLRARTFSNTPLKPCGGPSTEAPLANA
jgi:TnpA family transposase